MHTIANNGGVRKVNLDASNTPDIARESGKPNIGLIVGIAVILFLIAMTLWAVIPRKSDSR